MHNKVIKHTWLKQVRGMKKVAVFKKGTKKESLSLNGTLASVISTLYVPQNIPLNNQDNGLTDDQNENKCFTK